MALDANEGALGGYEKGLSHGQAEVQECLPQVQKKFYSDNVPITPADALTQLRPQLLRHIRFYLRKTQYAAVFQTQQILQDIQGVLWLEFAQIDSPLEEWPRGLRRALYLEFETTKVHASLHQAPLGDSRKPPADALRFSDEENHAEILQALQKIGWLQCGLAPAAKQLHLTRRQLKVQLTHLWKSLQTPVNFVPLERRIARLLSPLSTGVPSPWQRQEARAILRLLAQLNAPPHLNNLRGLLTILAARKTEGRPGNQGFANADAGPRAKEGE